MPLKSTLIAIAGLCALYGVTLAALKYIIVVAQ